MGYWVEIYGYPSSEDTGLDAHGNILTDIMYQSYNAPSHRYLYNACIICLACLFIRDVCMYMYMWVTILYNVGERNLAKTMTNIY